MTFQSVIYVLLPFAAAIVLFVLATYAFSRRRTPGAMPFGLLMLTACEWKLAYGLGLVVSDLQARLFLHNLEYVGAVMIPVAWLAFVLDYTGLGEWLSWRRLILLGTLPLLTLVLVWTNGAHGLVWINREFVRPGPFATMSIDHGPWFWVFAAYAYCLLLAGTLLLIAQLLRSSRAYRKQTATVLVGVGVLWAGNVAYLLHLSPGPYLNPTLLSFPLTGVLFAWSLFRLRLLDVVPVARDLLIEQISDGVIVVDERNRVVDLNPAAEHILGRQAPEVLWCPVTEVLPGISISPVSSEESAIEEIQAEEVRTAEVSAEEANLEVKIGEGERARYYERALSELDSRSGQPGGHLVLLRDITEHRWLEERLEHQAFYDPLTNLPNRTLLIDRISHALERLTRRSGDQHSEQEESTVAVLFLDLDNFKAINDSLGHETGDMLLVGVAERIRSCLRPEDTLARLGGDEFIALLEETRREGAILVAERIAQELGRPFYIGEHELFTSSSIGISFSDLASGFVSGANHPGTAHRGWEELLKEADIAMYRAKERGKARHEIFEGWMDLQATERLKLSNDLRRSVEREEFVLHYQPIAHLTTGKIEGFEALLRWEHPERGLLLPDEFIHTAEESGLMVPLGRWVLRKAALQAAQWHQDYPDVPPPLISVNLSPRQFGRSELVEEVEEIMRHAGLAPYLLKFEVTESAAMNDAPSTIEAFGRLKALGAGIAIDDFGTGYSSLSYLTRFPVDSLKIDRSIIEGIDQDPKKTAVVQSIVTLSHSLDQRVVAEGVETHEQLRYLRELECELGQGYLFWEPRPAEAAIGIYLQTLERAPAWASPS